MKKFWLAAVLVVGCRTTVPIDWTAYGHDAGGTRHSPAAQITPDNVSKLEVAWVYRTGDYGVGESAARFETTPLLVDGTLYLTTPFGRVIALDPDSGVERWNYDPHIDFRGDYGDFANRGASTWRDPKRRAGDPCARRIFVATIDSRLIALDSASGAPCHDFGVNGEVNLERDLINAPRWKGEYEITSPPAILGDRVIVGSAIGDNNRADAPSGVVRAFDVRTGALLWKWDPLPASTNVGAANAWSIFSVDAERNLVFIPTGSPSPDYYGGQRPGANLYSNSIVALRGTTGEVVWHFQAVHHDLWDYDVPAQPVLADWKGTPAVVQTTKMGNLFILDRATGKPLLAVEERPVPKSDVPGEQAWPTQPFPTNPPLVPQQFRADQIFALSDADREWCRTQLSALRNEGMFTPPSLQGTISYPGNVGGSNWGGVSVDPDRQLIVAPTNRLAATIWLIPRDQLAEARRNAGEAEVATQRGTPYAMKRWWLMTPGHVPCTPPPWGALSAVDLRTGAIRWEVPLGFLPWLASQPEHERWGSPNLGGAMTTSGGLVFVAGTFDQHLYAFDIESGRQIWRAELPAGGNAMPMTYVSSKSGRQFVVIAAGGHDRLHTKLGDFVMAYALPGAPLATPIARNISGEWHGHLVVGHTRFPVIVTFGADERTADFRSTDNTLSGTLNATRSGDRITYRGDFSYPAKSCRGTMAGTLDVANGGALLIGELELEHNCGEHPREPATLSLRR